jgi:hypothetical protein
MDLRSGSVARSGARRRLGLRRRATAPTATASPSLASHQGLKHTMPDQLAVLGPRQRRWDVSAPSGTTRCRRRCCGRTTARRCCSPPSSRAASTCGASTCADRRAERLVEGGTLQGFDKRAGTLVTLADASGTRRAARRTCRGSHRGASSASTTRCWPLALASWRAPKRSGSSSARATPRGPQAGRESAGDRVQMWLSYPPGFDPKKKYPLLHLIHGGPHTAFGDAFHYRWNVQVGRPGLCGGLRQLPRLQRLRLRLPRQHHAPLGRAGAAGHRSAPPTGCWRSPGPTRRGCMPPAAAMAASWWPG